MVRRPPRVTRTETLCPYTTRFRCGMSYLTEDDVARLRALPRPDTAAMVDLDDSTRKAIENRVSALTALIEGEPVKRVATLYGIHRKTCKRMLELANEPAPSGGVHGFAVCLPQVRLVDPKPRDKEDRKSTRLNSSH